MANIPIVLPLYSYIIIAIFSICQYYKMTKHNYHKSYIVAVILSHTHISICSVLLTLRASPRATPPSSSIPILSRLCLDNMKTQNLISTSHILNKYNDQCIHRKLIIIVMVIVKSEWLNLGSLVTAVAAFPVLEYLLTQVGNND